MVVDGIVGRHVDDNIGCGEGVNCEQDLNQDAGDLSCFSQRLAEFSRRLKFGRWDFGADKIFCGTEVS